MAWPVSQDYNEAIQDPQSSFSDPELKAGEAVLNALGMPMPRSGNFADVYEFNTPATKNKWAIKCFTRHVLGLRERYTEISAGLAAAKMPFAVEFQYLVQGIRVRGDWFPILQMRWVDGFLLNEFVRDNLDKPALLGNLGLIWCRMAKRLRDAGVAHADLQHGNVILVPGSKASSLAVKLIDYDGMFVPALANKKSGEVGHPNYQHPQRLRDGTYTAQVDRFPLLVVATALRALTVGGRELWDRHDNGDNLLFREADLKAPEKSALFQELSEMKDAQTRMLVETLKAAVGKKLEETPLVDELLPKTKPAEKRTAGTVPPETTTKPAEKASEFDDLDSAAPSRAKKKSGGLPLWVVLGGAAVAAFLCIGAIGAGVLWTVMGGGKPRDPIAKGKPDDQPPNPPAKKDDKKIVKDAKPPDKDKGDPSVPLKAKDDPARVPIANGGSQLDPSLLAHWRLDEAGDSALVADSSPNKFGGTLNFRAKERSVSGKAGLALALGPNGYVDISKVLPVLTKAKAFTLSAWVRNAENIVFSVSDATANQRVQFETGGPRLSYGWQRGNSFDRISAAAPGWERDRWYHLAVSVSGGDVMIYRDGRALIKPRRTGEAHNSQALAPVDLKSPSVACLGRLPCNDVGQQQVLNGDLGDVQLYGRALDEATISYLFEHPGIPLSSGKPPDVLVATGGFNPLFNGKELLGWKATWDVARQPDIESGVLTGSPALLTTLRDDYKDFHLRLEVRVKNECIIRFHANRSLYLKPDKARLNARNASLGPTVNMPSGDWVSVELIAQQNRLKVLLNGKVAIDVTDDKDASANASIHFRLVGKDWCEFRKIEIKDLSFPESAPSAKGFTPTPGFTPLIQDDQLSAWRPNPDWRVKNGVLETSKADANSLATARGDYKDFHLRFQARPKTNGFGGVEFRATAIDTLPRNSYMLRLTDFPNQADLGQRTVRQNGGGGSNFKSVSTPTGEWVNVELIAEGFRFKVVLGGQVAMDVEDKAKFLRSGSIVLAGGRDACDFRNMEIKELKAAAAKPGFTNSLGMKFVWIPPGSFMMGSPKEDKEKLAGETQHKVTLTKGFYMGVYTVTQEEWQAVMGKNPSNFKGPKKLPVETVSWDDCQEFIQKSREKDKNAYRLPTEAEWEYACRAGTTTPFHFGDTISTDQANYNGEPYANGKKGVMRGKTMPAGSFPGNAWGLHDMYGNVWQWCEDWHGDYPQIDVVDPRGPEKGQGRVVRGGSWFNDPKDLPLGLSWQV